MRKYLLLAFFAIPVWNTLAQNGNFRSIASGNWTNVTTWQRDADLDGFYEESPSTLSPTAADGAIIIQSGHNVLVNTNLQIDQTSVLSGGLITVNSGRVLTVLNGAGVDLTNSGAIRTTVASQLVFAESTEFEHQRNAGYIPLATWNNFSTCTVSGVTTGPPSQLAPPGGFYNFTWRGGLQTKNISLEGTLGNLRGTLLVDNTNNFLFLLSSNTVVPALTINNDLVVLNNSRLGLTLGGSITVNVLRDFIYLSNNATGSVLKDAGTATLTIGGLFSMGSGILNLTSGINTSNVNLNSNVSLTGGTIRKTGAGNGVISFNRTGTQQFNSTGVIESTIDYMVAASSTLEIVGESALTGRNLTVNGTLVLNSLNATGALVTGTTAGNIRTTNRTYNAGARIIYSGNGPQFLGNGHPTTSEVDLEIDNAAGVSFDQNTSGNSAATAMTIGGDLVLTSGNLNLVGGASSRRLQLERTVSAVAGNYITLSGSNIDLTVVGSGSFGTFPFQNSTQTVRNLLINRAGEVIAFNAPMSVSGTFTLTDGIADFNNSANLTGSVNLQGGVLSFANNALTISGAVTTVNGVLSANGESGLTLTGASAYSGALMFSGTGNTLGTLTMNKANAGISLTIGNPLTIVNNLTLTDGQLEIPMGEFVPNLTLGTGATINRTAAASISGNSPAGGPWNITYTGGSLSTGLEIPVSSSVLDVTVNLNNGSTVTLAENLTAYRLRLTRGILHNPGLIIDLNSGELVRHSSASLTGTNPTGVYRLEYTGSSLTPGLEIPANGILGQLYINITGGAIVMNRDLTTASFVVASPTATYSSGANNLTTDDFYNNGTFRAPNASATTGLTITATLANSLLENDGTFDNSGGTIIFAGNTTIQGNNQPTLHNIVIQGTLTPPSTFTLTGNFTNNGTFTSGGGTVNFNGTGIQSIDGSSATEFNNMVINNTTGLVRVEGARNLRGVLTLSANAKFDADGVSNTGVLTILSLDDDGQDASIAAIPGTASFQGNITVQRYFGAADNVSRFISAPVANAPVSQLQDDFPVTGNFTGTSYPCEGCGPSNGFSLRYYSEPRPGLLADGLRSTPAPGGSNAETLVVGRGYDAYMWNSVAPTVMDLRGPINQGTIPFAVSHTVSSPPEPSADGWNLIGNPFPSSIVWDGGAGWSMTNVDPTIWIWDVVGGAWRSYNYATQTGNLAGGVIATGQAFWVYVTPGATLSVNENAKTSASGTYYRRATSRNAGLQITMAQNQYSDKTFITFHEKGTPDFDQGLDAYKLELGIEKISIAVVDNKNDKLGHYITQKNGLTTDVPLSISAAEGDAELLFEPTGVSNELDGYTLVDRYLNTTASLSGSYAFSITADPASRIDRFFISRQSSERLNNSETSTAVHFYPNPVKNRLNIEVTSACAGQATLLDNKGHALQTVTLTNAEGRSKGEIDTEALSSGIYFVKVITSDNVVRIQKVLKH